MSKLHLYVDTNDLNWACSLAGAIMSARKDVHNSKFKCSFNSTTPAISILAKYFDLPGSNMTTIKIPSTEKEMAALDVFASRRQKMEIEEIHGVVADEIAVNRLPIANLAAQLIFRDYGLLCETSYFFPKLKVRPELNIFVGAVSTRSRLDYAVNFLKGYEMENPNIAILDELPEEDQLEILNSNLKVAVLEPNHRLLAVLRAYYTGFDTIQQAVPLIIVMPEGFTWVDRTIISWSTHLPMHESEDVSQAEPRGRWWAMRESCGHDHLEYQRRMARERQQGVVIQRG